MMEKELERIDELVVDYLLKGLESPEIDELLSWVEVSTANRTYFLQRREIWFSSVSIDDRHRFDAEAAFSRFLQRIKDEPIAKPIHLNWRKWLHYAAILILGIGGLISGSFYLGKRTVANQFSDITIEAPMGSRTKLFLPDGSLVWLNAGSKIVYSQGFGYDSRELILSGEAYFEVTRNESLPFFVKSDDLKLQVLGTKFNFRNYESDEEMIVSLLEGKVSLKPREDNCSCLIPDQKAIYNKKTHRIIISTTQARNSSLWSSGQLFFDDVQLSDIIRELERSYGVKVKLDSPELGSLRFYACFDRTSNTIDDVLSLLSRTNKMGYEIKGKEIILY